MTLAPAKRDNDIVIDLLMHTRRDWGTTRDYFTRNDFINLRDGIEKLEGLAGGRDAVAKLEKGEELSAREKELLHKTLGKFEQDGAACNAVHGWVKSHAKEDLPEEAFNVGGRPTFQSELRHDAETLAKIEKSDPGTIAALTQADTGEKPAVSKHAFEELKKAGLLSGRDEVTAIAHTLVTADGSKFMKDAGIDVAKLTADASRFASNAAKTATPRETVPTAPAAAKTPVVTAPGPRK